MPETCTVGPFVLEWFSRWRAFTAGLGDLSRCHRPTAQSDGAPMLNHRSFPHRLALATGALALLIGGCAASRERISSTLQAYGLDQQRADCASDYLHGHLTDRQIDRLSRAAMSYRQDDPRPAQLTFGDLLRISSALRDADIPLSVGAAAIACGLAGNIPLPRL